MAMNALMNAYASAGDAAAAAAVLGAMQRRGPRPNDISYNTAIAAHAQARLRCLLRATYYLEYTLTSLRLVLPAHEMLLMRWSS